MDAGWRGNGEVDERLYDRRGDEVELLLEELEELELELLELLLLELELLESDGDLLRLLPP